MEVREDFAERVSAIAESTPRNAIENLLLGLMPRVPVTARTVAADGAGRAMAPLAISNDGTVTEAPRTFFTKLTRAPRTRQPRGRAYTVLDPAAYRNHRAGTWTYAMVRAATDPDVTNTLAAVQKLRENYPQYDRPIDFNWLAKVGYISF